MDLVSRKGIDACRKLKAFDDELSGWLTDSDATGAFKRHGSQIRALEMMLKVVRGGAVPLVDCDSAPAPIPSLDASTDASRIATALFGIWDFFRVKLDQRRNGSYAEPLRYADELAWVCYRPARDRSLKEPPLVYFNGGQSPFILRRDLRFHAEAVPVELATSESVVAATSRLPFPVIGVPWTQVNHVPDAVSVAHEVGHAIEVDLGLRTELGRVTDAALKISKGSERKRYWQKWQSELFADLYGCLATGPAFPRALRDFIAAPPAAVAAEEPSGASGYPPVALRIRFNAAVLEAMGFETQEQLWAGWQQAYPDVPSTLAPFFDDAVEIARAWHSTKLTALGDHPLTSILTFTADQLALGKDLAGKAVDRQRIPATSDIRVLFAAARLAYDADPGSYDTEDEVPDGHGGIRKVASTHARLRDQIIANVADVYRDGETPTSDAHQRQHVVRAAGWLDLITAKPGARGGRTGKSRKNGP